MTLNAGHFGLQAPGVPFAPIELGSASDPRVINGHGFHALFQHVQYIVQLALDQSAHRVELIFQPGPFDNFQAPRHHSANAFSNSKWRHAEFKENHKQMAA
jgi:hypothetical protein